MSKRKFERLDKDIAKHIFEEITIDKLNGITPEYNDEQIKILRDYIYVSNITEILLRLANITEVIRNK